MNWHQPRRRKPYRKGLGVNVVFLHIPCSFLPLANILFRDHPPGSWHCPGLSPPPSLTDFACPFLVWFPNGWCLGTVTPSLPAGETSCSLVKPPSAVPTVKKTRLCFQPGLGAIAGTARSVLCLQKQPEGVMGLSTTACQALPMLGSTARIALRILCANGAHQGTPWLAAS